MEVDGNAFTVTQAELELKLSEVGLRRVMGTLLLYDNVVYTRTIENGAPALSIGQGEDLVDPALQSTPTGPGQQPFNDTEMMSPEQLEQLQSDPPVTPSTNNASQSKFEPHLPIQRAGSVSGETEFQNRTFGYPLQDSSKQ